MPDYLAPGVYVEEVPNGPKPIEGVSTSNAGFVGPTERGPEFAKLITSWPEFQRWYGGYIYETSFLPHAVQGFFDNGGKRCFIARVVADSATFANTTVGDLHLYAIGRGLWGERVVVRILAATNPSNESAFRLRVLYFSTTVPETPDSDKTTDAGRKAIADFEAAADTVEDFDNLTLDSPHRGGYDRQRAITVHSCLVGRHSCQTSERLLPAHK